MTRIYALLFVTALACSTLNPVLKPIANCAGKTVAASDANEALNDLLTQNWTDLAAEGLRIGWDMLDCIISDITTQAPALKPAATEFKTLHAVEFRSAGVGACNGLQMRGPHAPTASTGQSHRGSAVPSIARGDVPGAAISLAGVEFLTNPPPCYLPGITKLRSRPGTCVEVTRDGAQGVVASDGRFIPIDRTEPAWLTAWKNPAMPDKRVPPLTVYEADGCPDGWVDDGVVYVTSPGQLDCYPIKKPAAAR